MIINTQIADYERVANFFGFRPWQSGLLSELMGQQSFKRVVNMGAGAGHTFFAISCARVEFPVKTKVYASKQNISEFSHLIFNPNKCHSIVDVIGEDVFSGFNGPPVQLVVVDLNKESLHKFKQSLRVLYNSMPSTTALLVLDADYIV